MALIDKLTAIADAIRGKTGGTDPLTLAQMAAEIAGIEAGDGGRDDVKELLENNLDVLESSTATAIKVSRICSNNTTLRKVYLPEVVTMESYIFQGCTSLAEVYLPKLETMTMANFYGCIALEAVELPRFYAFGGNSNFQDCTNLKKVDFQRKDNPAGAYQYNMSQNAFLGCSVFDVLIIRAEDSIWKLGNINCFSGTPFAEGGAGGAVYVPSALIAEYQQATNWSLLVAAGSMTFAAIEGSEYE